MSCKSWACSQRVVAVNIVFLGNFQVDYSSENHHKKSLESLGHTVVAMQETQAGSENILQAALDADMFVWVHTHGWQTPGSVSMEEVLKQLKQAGIPTVTYHLDLWLGLNRQKDLETDPVYKYIEYFFTVDKLMADWFNENTEVKGHFLPAGVLEEECYIDDGAGLINDVIFVGSRNYHPEWPYRPQLIDWLKQTYGSSFKHFGGDGLGVVRGAALNQLYGSSKIVVGDTLCINFDYPEYISDRVFETTGRGGFIIHPYIKGIENHFELGKELITYEYGDFTDLYSKINYYIHHAEERDAIRLAGHKRTKRDHTYKKRWETILKEVGL